MNFTKKLAVALTLSATIATVPAMAQTASVPVQANDIVELNTSVDTNGLAFAFDNDQDLQVKDINQQEMEDTKGAWFWVPILVGAAALGYSNSAH